MVNVTCDKYTASVEAKGPAKTLFVECLGLILEGFKLIRRLDNTLYEKTKEDIFFGILDGKLDNCTEPTDNADSTEIRVDLNKIISQMKEEEGDN